MLLKTALVLLDTLFLLVDAFLLFLLRQAPLLLLLLLLLLLRDLLLADLLLLRLCACVTLSIGPHPCLFFLLPLHGQGTIPFRLLLSSLLHPLLLLGLHFFTLLRRGCAISFRLLLARLLDAIALLGPHFLLLRCCAFPFRLLRPYARGGFFRLRSLYCVLLLLRFRLWLVALLVLGEGRSACSHAHKRGNDTREYFLVRACNVHGSSPRGWNRIRSFRYVAKSGSDACGHTAGGLKSAERRMIRPDGAHALQASVHESAAMQACISRPDDVLSSRAPGR